MNRNATETLSKTNLFPPNFMGNEGVVSKKQVDLNNKPFDYIKRDFTAVDLNLQTKTASSGINREILK